MIGGSIALRARTLGASVCAWDVRPDALAEALALGLADATAESFAELVQRCDVLVLAAPLDATLAQLAELERLPVAASLIIDVASVKGPVARAGRGIAHFVGTHPLAGSERRGPGAAQATLFAGKTWAVSPAADPDDARRALAFIAAMGARALELDPDEHDRIVALTSHLPQLVSVMLGATLNAALGEASVSALCGTGMASMLRLGNSGWPIWEPILAANSRPVAQEVRALGAILMDAAALLEAGNAGELEPAFAAAAEAVARLENNGLDISHVDTSTARLRPEPNA